MPAISNKVKEEIAPNLESILVSLIADGFVFAPFIHAINLDFQM